MPNDLKSRHWRSGKSKYFPPYLLLLAVNNSPPMKMGDPRFDGEPVKLVQQAYNIIASRLIIPPFPIEVTEVYDLRTTEAIGRLQDRLQLEYRGGHAAGAETLMAMDDWLLTFAIPKPAWWPSIIP